MNTVPFISTIKQTPNVARSSPFSARNRTLSKYSCVTFSVKRFALDQWLQDGDCISDAEFKKSIIHPKDFTKKSIKIKPLRIKSNKIKFLLHSRYDVKVRNEWRDPSPRLSVWATQLRRNAVAVGNSVSDLIRLGIEPQTSRADSNAFNHDLHSPTGRYQ